MSQGEKVLSSRKTLAVTLLIALGIVGLVSTWPVMSQTNPDPPPDWTPPDLPPGVTLNDVVSQQTARAHFVGKTCVRIEPTGPPKIAPLPVVMDLVLKMQPATLTRLNTSAPQQDSVLSQKVQSVQALFGSCRNTEQIVETLLKANTKDHVYKNSDIIQAAEGRCSSDRIAQWRVRYPDN